MQKYAINIIFHIPAKSTTTYIIIYSVQRYWMPLKCQCSIFNSISTIAAKNIAQFTTKYNSCPTLYSRKNVLPSSIQLNQLNSSSADEKKAILLKKQHSAPSAFAIECQLRTSSFDHARNSSIRATFVSQKSNCLNTFHHFQCPMS